MEGKEDRVSTYATSFSYTQSHSRCLSHFSLSLSSHSLRLSFPHTISLFNTHIHTPHTHSLALSSSHSLSRTRRHTHEKTHNAPMSPSGSMAPFPLILRHSLTLGISLTPSHPFLSHSNLRATPKTLAILPGACQTRSSKFPPLTPFPHALCNS